MTTVARAAHTDISGLAEAGFLTHETVSNLTELPKRLAVIGGGPIGCELAQALCRLGAQVTIIQKSRFLPHEEENASALLADGETLGFVKVMVRQGTDRILGATIVAPHAGDMINEIRTVMVAGAGLKSLGSVNHSYPTQAKAIKRAAGLYNRSRLRPMVAKNLKWWLNLQR